MELGGISTPWPASASGPVSRRRPGWSRCPSSVGQARPGHPPVGAPARIEPALGLVVRRRFGSPGSLDPARRDRRRARAWQARSRTARMVSTGVGFKVSSMCCRTSLMAGSNAPFSRRVQVFPPILDEALGFIDAAELAEHRHEQSRARPSDRCGDPGGVAHEPLGGRKLPGFMEEVHPPLDRSFRERGPRHDARPGLAGRLVTPSCQLAGPQQVNDFPRSGPPSRTRACPVFGRRSRIDRPRSPIRSPPSRFENGDPSTRPRPPRGVPPRRETRAASIVAGSAGHPSVSCHVGD